MEDAGVPILPSKLPKNYKYMLCILIIALFSFIPSELFNPSFLDGTWELIYVLLVGITVSYGLFSRRNTLPLSVNDLPSKPNATELLGLSSVFSNDDMDRDAGALSERRMEAWSSRYHPNEPVVVKESAVLRSPIPWQSRSASFQYNNPPPTPPPPPPPPQRKSFMPSRPHAKQGNSNASSLEEMPVGAVEGFEVKKITSAKTSPEQKLPQPAAAVPFTKTTKQPEGDEQGGENEVDKKADEFIAKFREQIRLQRINSIKKSIPSR